MQAVPACKVYKVGVGLGVAYLSIALEKSQSEIYEPCALECVYSGKNDVWSYVSNVIVVFVFSGKM